MTPDLGIVFVANRGEIAVRIIRAAHELGLKAVLGCSEADTESLAARMADSLIVVGAAPAAKSYLDVGRMVAAAVESGAALVHPGYGFLSENEHFAAAVVAAGLIFVGPDSRTISLMGNKASARACAAAAGVPTVPGSEGVLTSIEAAFEAASRIGYPVMLKAAAGGGGRGIRIAGDAAELAEQFAGATREAEGAFGNGDLYLERYVSRARHVEVQILGDGVNAVHLFDRECSLQRRRQKLVEEAPSPTLDSPTRERLCASAVALAQSVGYSGAGTVEYLFDDGDGTFFFIEMNTRVQVEHPVTEMITGIDIVRETLGIALGRRLQHRQSEISMRGAAIECRINAENPFKNFLPSPGVVTDLRLPSGPGVRVDSLLFEGYRVPPYYDSLLAKTVVWDESRSAAVRRMQRALGELNIGGVHTTKGLHLALMQDAGFVAAACYTGYVEEHMPRLIEAMQLQ